MLRPRRYRRWIRETAAFIKSLDANHFITIGSEGKTPFPIGNHPYKDHKDKNKLKVIEKYVLLFEELAIPH